MMRSLNEIVSDNARLALAAASRDSEEAGRGKLKRKAVARRMATRMGANTETVYRQLAYLLADPPERPWRVDYIEAFAEAVSVRPELLASPDYLTLLK